MILASPKKTRDFTHERRFSIITALKIFLFLSQNVFLHYQKLFQECQQHQVRLHLLQEQRQREQAMALLLPQHPLLLDAVNNAKSLSQNVKIGELYIDRVQYF